MATDVLRTNRLRLGSLIFVFIFLGFVVGYAQECKFYEKEFIIRGDDYPEFRNDLNSFYSSKHEYDIIYLKVAGGDTNSATLKRTYHDKGWKQYTISKKDTSRIVKSVDLNKNTFELLYDNLKKGYFIEICPYSSSNNSHIYLLRRKGLIVFGYSSAQNNVNGVSGLKEILGTTSFQ